MLKIPALTDSAGQNPDQATPANQPDAAQQGVAFDADHAMRMAQFNEAGVKSAQADWLGGMNAILYDPTTGFLNQKGAAAMGGFGAAQDAVEKYYKQISDSLGNPIQRDIFSKVSDPLLDAFRAQIQQHAASQCRVYDHDASQSSAQNACDLAVNAYNPAPGADNTLYRYGAALYRYGAALYHNNLENIFSHTCPVGPDNENYQALLDHHTQFGPDGNGGMVSLHNSIINRLLGDNQPQEARCYLDQVQHTLPEPTRDKLDQYICTATDQKTAYQTALQAQAQETDLAKQQAILDGKLKNGQISQNVHDIAQQTLQASQNQMAAVQKQNDEQVIANVLGLKNNNPNAAITDIPASNWAYLTSRGLDRNAQAILDSHPATDDPKRFNDLHRLSIEDPVKFTQTNLLTESGNISQAHYKYLQTLQDAINKQDPQQMQASKVVNTAVNTLRAEMKMAGINPEPGSPEEQQQAQIESDLRDQLIAAQQAKNGTPLTPEEAQNIAMGYFADHVLNGKGGGMLRNGEEKQPQAQGGKHKTAPSMQNTDSPQAQAVSEQTFFSPPNIMPHGAPVATVTMADARKVYPAALAVGQQMPNGAIAAGDDPDSRVYVAKAKGKGRTVDLWKISEETGCDFDQLKALNKIKRDGVWIPNGTKVLLPPQPADDPAHQPVIDIEKSTSTLDGNAEDDPTGYCSRAVFKAINAGRPANKQITGPDLAKKAGPILEASGFKKVLTNSDQLASYSPRKGDVVVLQDYPDQDPPAGHIAMFDGKHWVSDYVQDKKYGSRIWAGGSFENNKVGMAIYRP
jgi:hypothetical protein